MIFNLYQTGTDESVTVRNTKGFLNALRSDHVGVEFKDGIRRSACFISSNVVIMMCDNSTCDNSSEWVTAEDFEKECSSLNYALVNCKSRMRETDDDNARPKFLVYFPITECVDALKYTAIKRAVQKAYPFFDEMTLDCARSYGSFRNVTVTWNEGGTNIDKAVKCEVSECDAILDRIGGGDLLVSVDDDNDPSYVDRTAVKMRSTVIEGDNVYLSSTGVAKNNYGEDVVLLKLSGLQDRGGFSMRTERCCGADYVTLSFQGAHAYNEALTLIKSAYLTLLSQKKGRGGR